MSSTTLRPGAGHPAHGTAAQPDLALLVGRILLVAIFPISAWSKITGWPGIVETLAQQGAPLPMPGGLLAVAVEMLGALLVILGLWTRWAAVALMLYVAGATIVAHRFWEFAPPQQFGQMMQFLKSLAMIGGLLLLALVGPGRYAVRPRP